MRDERLGRRTAGDSLHHGRLYFKKALASRNWRMVVMMALRFLNRSMMSGLAHRSTYR